MPYVALIHTTFATQANADHIFDQALTVATNASVARVGSPGERTSHGGVYKEQPDGTLVPLRRFHLDRFGVVRQGALQPDDVIPDWIQPQGGQNAYPLVDLLGQPTRVRHDGQVWEATIGNNVWEPGAYGWQVVT